MRWSAFLMALSAMAIVACQPTSPPKPPESLKVARIATSAEPIEEGKPLPQFLQHFATGTTVVYSYVWIENTESMTGSFTVRMRWHYPNDLRPPIASRDVAMEPGQTIAQFSLHNEEGLDAGPYQLLAYAGKNASELTASGSARLFVGMTPEEAAEFLEEEAAFIKARDEERARREAEREQEEKEEARRKAPDPTSPNGLRGAGEAGTTMTETILPPELTDGAGGASE